MILIFHRGKVLPPEQKLSIVHVSLFLLLFCIPFQLTAQSANQTSGNGSADSSSSQAAPG
jgi:hypothetical protein